MVSDTFQTPCGWFPGLRSVQKVFRADLPTKNMIFQWKIHWFPHMGSVGCSGSNLSENQWFSAVSGSSAANWLLNSTEIIQKLYFWACKSSPEHTETSRNQNTHRSLKVHILYKSFKGLAYDVSTQATMSVLIFFRTVCCRESIVLIHIFFCDQIMFWSFEFFGL